MTVINMNTVPEEIESLKPYAPYLMWSPVPEGEEKQYLSLQQWHDMFPVWPFESMIYGISRVAELAEKGNKILFDAYSPEEIAEDPTREHVKFWFMPSENQPSDKPFILCYAGGGYTTVCSDVEAFPTAARMNELGYNVFVPTYRVGLPDLMPKPLEDVAAVLRCILKNKEYFGIRNDEYAVNGFSAGANLTCLWGLNTLGYARYELPKPKALFPVYPVTHWGAFAHGLPDGFLRTMFGDKYDMDTVRAYDIVNNMTAEYPPCYLVHAKDDPMVPYMNSVLMKEKLELLGIPAVLELAAKGNHGFGDGRGTDAQGWIDRAIEFLGTL